jgi:starvation-inducible DNA-binding protein
MLSRDAKALQTVPLAAPTGLNPDAVRDIAVALNEQADQIFATTDDIAERVRKISGTTLRSIGHVSRLQRVIDNDADYVTPLDMLAKLQDDNEQLTVRMRETHDLCDEHGDVATAS